MKLRKFFLLVVVCAAALLATLMFAVVWGGGLVGPRASLSAQSETDDAGSRIEIEGHGYVTVSDAYPSLGETVTVETHITGTDGAAARNIGVAARSYVVRSEASQDI